MKRINTNLKLWRSAPPPASKMLVSPNSTKILATTWGTRLKTSATMTLKDFAVPTSTTLRPTVSARGPQVHQMRSDHARYTFVVVIVSLFLPFSLSLSTKSPGEGSRNTATSAPMCSKEVQ